MSDETMAMNGAFGLWEVCDGGETFWIAVREGSSAIVALANEHGLDIADMEGATAERVPVAAASATTIGDEDHPGVRIPLLRAFADLAAEIEAGRSGSCVVAATAW